MGFIERTFFPKKFLNFFKEHDVVNKNDPIVVEPYRSV